MTRRSPESRVLPPHEKTFTFTFSFTLRVEELSTGGRPGLALVNPDEKRSNLGDSKSPVYVLRPPLFYVGERSTITTRKSQCLGGKGER